MSDNFHYFARLPNEVQYSVWQEAISSPPGFHTFRLERSTNSPPADGRDGRIMAPDQFLCLLPPKGYTDNHAPDSWTCVCNPSADVRTNELRQVSAGAREAIDGTVRSIRSPWKAFDALNGIDRLVFNPERDVVHLQFGEPPGFDGEEVFDPRCLPAPLAGHVLGSAFPQLRGVRRIALDVNLAADPDADFEEQVRRMDRRTRNTLWVPAHFPNLQTVYLVSRSTAPHRIVRPRWDRPADREVFEGHGCRYVEIRMEDLARLPAAQDVLWEAEYCEEAYKSCVDAFQALPAEEVPEFWHLEAPHQKVEYKVLGLVAA